MSSRPATLDDDTMFQPAPGWSRSRRWIVSILLLFHLGAMWTGPWSVPPSSILAGRMASFYRPYLDATFLNNGYNFFAPEPGPSHLIRYEIEMPDGQTREGIFPNLREQQPRLRYHRHFMLSETINLLNETYYAQQERIRAEISDPARIDEELEALRHPLPLYVRSFGEHLLDAHGGVRVKLFLRRHEILSPMQVLAGMKLDDPSTYPERELGVIERPDGAGEGEAP